MKLTAQCNIVVNRFLKPMRYMTWTRVHVMYLIGFKNRLTTMLHWAVSFIFRGRSQRTTTRQQIVARTLMARLESAQEALNQAENQAPAVEPSAANPQTQEALNQAENQAPAVEPSAANPQTEAVGTDSVDELSAAYGDQGAEGRDAAPLKQA